MVYKYIIKNVISFDNIKKTLGGNKMKVRLKFFLKIDFDLRRLTDILKRLSRRVKEYSMTLLDRWYLLVHLIKGQKQGTRASGFPCFYFTINKK